MDIDKIDAETRLFFGKIEYQDFFERLLKIALLGMNINGSYDVNESGELPVLKYIKNKLQSQNPILFDVGAYVGDYTCILKSNFPNAIIHSFEPCVESFNTLSAKMKTNNVFLHNFGFSKENTTSFLFKEPRFLFLNSIYKRNLQRYNMDNSETESVTLKSIDSFCQENSISSIDFLKIDVEGAELDVLLGASKMLQNIQFIQFEFGATDVDSRVFFRDFFFLLNDHFDIFRIVKNGIRKILEYKDDLEIFGYCNFLAQRKIK
jgi:FkbM family methyltransferase